MIWLEHLNSDQNERLLTEIWNVVSIHIKFSMHETKQTERQTDRKHKIFARPHVDAAKACAIKYWNGK
jgi:hypothetical protein